MLGTRRRPPRSATRFAARSSKGNSGVPITSGVDLGCVKTRVSGERIEWIFATRFYVVILDGLQAANSANAENAGMLPTSERRIARDGDPMHASAFTRVIVERTVLRAAVIPDRQRTDLPAEAAGVLGLDRMRTQEVEDWTRLGRLETHQRLRVVADVDAFARRLRVRAHDRVRGLGLQVAGIAHPGGHLLVATVAAIRSGPDADLVDLHQPLAVADVEGLHVLQHGLHGIG